MSVRAVLERGPKEKKVVVFAVDWPGWSRGAKTPELALDLLESYRDRYRPVAVAAGMAAEVEAAGALELAEDRGAPARPTSGESRSRRRVSSRSRWKATSSNERSR